MGIISCNAYLLLKDYGFILKNDEIENTVKENTSGMLILKESGALSFLRLPDVFSEGDDSAAQIDKISEKKYRSAQKGEIDIEFLHHEIQKPLIEIQNDIIYNLKIPMRRELEKFIIELCKKQATEDEPIRIDHNAIYNYFQRNSRHSKKNIESIRSLIREYLMVDHKWG